MRPLLALTFAALLAAGCKTVEFGSGNPDVTPSDTGTAEILFANRLDKDGGAVAFLLFGATAENVDAAIPVSTLATVAVNQTATAKVPAGRWKIGYEEESKDRHSMPADSIGGSPDWPVVVIAKGGSYGLALETDEGGVTIWRNDLPAVSP